MKFPQIAEIAKLEPNEYKKYEASLNAYRDMKNSIDWAHIKGKAEGKLEIAIKLIERGMDNEAILEITGLSKGEIEKLRGRL